LNEQINFKIYDGIEEQIILDYNKYRGLTLYQAFSKNAKESADEPCTIFKNKVFKYEYVAFRIEQTAHLLKKHGACGGGGHYNYSPTQYSTN
jgi:hypothetical protein